MGKEILFSSLENWENGNIFSFGNKNGTNFFSQKHGALLVIFACDFSMS